MTRIQAKKLAMQMAREAGCPELVAEAIARAYAPIHDPEFTAQEVRNFINYEIQLVKSPGADLL